VIAEDADVVAVLTGNLLKDPDYTHRYHTGALGVSGPGDFANPPVQLSYDTAAICAFLSAR